MGTSDPDIHVDRLISGLACDGLSAIFQLERQDDNPETWKALNVANSKGQKIVHIERNSVIEGDLAKTELNEFREDIRGCEPASAVRWLEKYLNKIVVIYAFEILSATSTEEDFPILSSMRKAIWKTVGGILQSDGEGFSNEEGYHILWQFNDGASGAWNMAVRTFPGRWKSFEMDLGSPEHQKAFRDGKVPRTAQRPRH